MRDLLPGEEMLVYPSDTVCRMDAPDFSKLDEQGQLKYLPLYLCITNKIKKKIKFNKLNLI